MNLSNKEENIDVRLNVKVINFHNFLHFPRRINQCLARTIKVSYQMAWLWIGRGIKVESEKVRNVNLRDVFHFKRNSYFPVIWTQGKIFSSILVILNFFFTFLNILKYLDNAGRWTSFLHFSSDPYTFYTFIHFINSIHFIHLYINTLYIFFTFYTHTFPTFYT